MIIFIAKDIAHIALENAALARVEPDLGTGANQLFLLSHIKNSPLFSPCNCDHRVRTQHISITVNESPFHTYTTRPY